MTGPTFCQHVTSTLAVVLLATASLSFGAVALVGIPAGVNGRWSTAPAFAGDGAKPVDGGRIAPLETAHPRRNCPPAASGWPTRADRGGDRVSSLDFTPITAAQRQAIEDNSDVLLFCGSWGSAKTEAMLRKVVAVLYTFPGISVRLLRYLARDSRAMLWPRLLAMLPSQWVKELNRSDATMVVDVGKGKPSLVRFGGLKPSEGEVNPWAGTEFGFTGIDEATEIPDAETFDRMIRRSARQPGVAFNQVMLCTNAGAPGHWLYQWFYEGKAPQASDPSLPRVRYRLIEGRTIPASAGILPASYYAMLSGLTGILRQRYVENQWVAHEGLVYPFDPRRQIIELRGDNYVNGLGEVVVSAAVLNCLPWRVGVDFGFEHPFVASWWRVSSDDRWYLQRQVYMTHRTVAEHAKQMIEIHQRLGLPLPIRAVCDHDAEDSATLRAAGIITTPAYKARLRGQQEVWAKFPHADPADATGETMTPCRVHFCTDALVERDPSRSQAGLPCCTVDEFGGYVWASGAKEDMSKNEDHGMDEMRYAMCDGLAERTVRVDLSRVVAPVADNDVELRRAY